MNQDYFLIGIGDFLKQAGSGQGALMSAAMRGNNSPLAQASPEPAQMTPPVDINPITPKADSNPGSAILGQDNTATGNDPFFVSNTPAGVDPVTPVNNPIQAPTATEPIIPSAPTPTPQPTPSAPVTAPTAIPQPPKPTQAAPIVSQPAVAPNISHANAAPSVTDTIAEPQAYNPVSNVPQQSAPPVNFTATEKPYYDFQSMAERDAYFAKHPNRSYSDSEYTVRPASHANYTYQANPYPDQQAEFDNIQKLYARNKGGGNSIEQIANTFHPTRRQFALKALQQLKEQDYQDSVARVGAPQAPGYLAASQY